VVKVSCSFFGGDGGCTMIVCDSSTGMYRSHGRRRRRELLSA